MEGKKKIENRESEVKSKRENMKQMTKRGGLTNIQNLGFMKLRNELNLKQTLKENVKCDSFPIQRILYAHIKFFAYAQNSYELALCVRKVEIQRIV